MDYKLNAASKKNKGINYNNYYIENPTRVKTLVPINIYKTTDFIPKYVKEEVPLDTYFDVNDVEFSFDGYPRLKIKKGYCSANKIFVQQVSEESREESYDGTRLRK
ncbi:DUF5776 domain-containing protein [Sporosarcina ureilytica]|uniref:DUF5776 domain-containing protein n=1 Tax=Sporosarcina ureilytica TaxID=298596 RepID=A0A1D8JJP5_9BACL|nr:DUF5776 domain-containing protein [Sporosarcina ureilytica]AOV08929.1 hypothetical protein BI350_16155 [Sporosarcina ureilytica]